MGVGVAVRLGVETEPKYPAPRYGLGLGVAGDGSAPLCDTTFGDSLGTGADAASPLILLLPLPALLEEGAIAKAVSVALPADPAADVAGVCEGALPEALGLDADGAGAESVVGEARGTTGLLPGVVPGEDGGTGTLLCMHIRTVFSRKHAVVREEARAGEYLER